MPSLPRIKPGETKPVALLAFLLFTNTLVLESNEVLATSGFVSNVGVDGILAVWAVVMIGAMVTSGFYTLIVDRMDRARLAAILFMVGSLIYLGFYFLFTAHLADVLAYSLLAIVTEQQWTMLPLVIWALGNDVFSTAAAKRLFPLLASVVVLGGVAGNGLAAAIGSWLGPSSYSLLVFNGAMLLLGAAALFVALPSLGAVNQQDRQHESLGSLLREGFDFVANVPAFRHLALVMILMGFCLNTLQYQFLVEIAVLYPEPGPLQTFYAAFKLASVPLIMLIQGLLTPWLLNKLGFKAIFALMPAASFLSLLLALVWVSPIGVLMLTGAIFGNFVTRVVLSGIDQPARQAFEGMVPDQRRGRVSAMLEGFLYQGGSVASCAVLGLLLVAGRVGLLSTEAARMVGVGLSLLCALVALIFVRWLYTSYDASLLNWRLRRRQQGRGVLDQLKF